MRGKDQRWQGRRMVRGIIPAHAGKIPALARAAYVERDHPRSCGEKYIDQSGNEYNQGSSPLMRGKESKMQAPQAVRRIIPAHAGKRLKQVAKTGYFLETLHFSISIWYTKWVSLQSADTRCIPAVSN